MNMDNIYNPSVCPSSLDEHGEASTEGVTAHIWDNTTDPVTCAECGAEQGPEDLIARQEEILSELTAGKGTAIDGPINELLEIERQLTLMEE